MVIFMISQTLTQSPGTGIAPKQTYDILLELQSDGTHQASVLGWVDCHATGATEEDAIDSLRKVLSDRLAHSKILQLEIPRKKDSSRSLSEIFASIDQLMWTPPEGSKTGVEMIREDRDS